MPPGAVLVVLDGTERGRRIEVDRRMTLGRGDDAGVFIDDPEVSRAHAVAATTPDGLELTDLGSLNGTWVNGERISRSVILAPGDVIRVGATQIEVLSTKGRAAGGMHRTAPTPVDAEDE